MPFTSDGPRSCGAHVLPPSVVPSTQPWTSLAATDARFFDTGSKVPISTNPLEDPSNDITALWRSTSKKPEMSLSPVATVTSVHFLPPLVVREGGVLDGSAQHTFELGHWADVSFLFFDPLGGGSSALHVRPPFPE